MGVKTKNCIEGFISSRLRNREGASGVVVSGCAGSGLTGSASTSDRRRVRFVYATGVAKSMSECGKVQNGALPAGEIIGEECIREESSVHSWDR